MDFLSDRDPVRAVSAVDFHVSHAETLCILGESGSGKSVSTSAIMGLIDTPPGDIVAGRMFFEGRDLATMTEEERRDINGRKIAMIFQDPLAYLNPVHSIGRQIAEVFETHGVASGRRRQAPRGRSAPPRRHPRSGATGWTSIRTSSPAASGSA